MKPYPHAIPMSAARSLLKQIATGRVTDPQSIKGAALRILRSLPNRDDWDPPMTVSVEVAPMPPPASPFLPTKNKGGRPKGSKNKPKAAPKAPPDGLTEMGGVI